MAKVDIESFNEMLSQVNSFIMEVPKRIEELKDRITHQHDMIVDIQHFIEFNKLNASDGYKVQAKLKEVLNTRRELKEELEYLESIGSQSKQCLKKDNALQPISHAIRDKKRTINSRVYTPRVLVDLFNNDGKGIKL